MIFVWDNYANVSILSVHVTFSEAVYDIYIVGYLYIHLT